jgi:hypothetical protein
MGWNSWLVSEQNEISFRLVSPQWPASANPVKLTLFRASGQVSVETPFGQDDSGYWEKPFDTSMYLSCKVQVSLTQTVDVNRFFYIIENTHVYACRDDPATFMAPWEDPMRGSRTFDTPPAMLPPGAAYK